MQHQQQIFNNCISIAAATTILCSKFTYPFCFPPPEVFSVVTPKNQGKCYIAAKKYIGLKKKQYTGSYMHHHLNSRTDQEEKAANPAFSFKTTTLIQNNILKKLSLFLTIQTFS